MDDLLKNKNEHLISFLKSLDSLVVAFSGGVDSTFLLATAHNVLKKNIFGVTAESPVHPVREEKAAIKLAGQLGVKHITVQSREMNNAKFVANQPNRCYICKKLLGEDLFRIASNLNFDNVAHGANLDDYNDYRPGLQAAREIGIIAPLVEAGLTKKDIRRLSKEMGLPTWNKPSQACLATRIPYGSLLTTKKLKMAEQAEDVLFNLGFKICRVRCHQDVARIEMSSGDFKKISSNPTKILIIDKFKEIGFNHIAVDLEGYVQGSMNRSIKE